MHSVIQLNDYNGLMLFMVITVLYSLSYSTPLVPNAGSYHVYLISIFIRFNSCLLRKVKCCIGCILYELCALDHAYDG